MSVFRVEKNKNYTTMSNYHLREKEMSLKAIGLLSKMLSLPDNWDYTLVGLVSICKENETAIKSALDELKEFGYLEVNKKMPNQTNTGRIEYEYIIYEKPKQEGEKQALENLPVEIQPLENQTQLSINELSIKKENINNIDNNVEKGKISKKDLILKENIKCIIDYLNETANTKYKYNTKGTISLIKARFNEGYTLDDFYDVIDNKWKDWKNTEWQKYIRPETLFGNKFENYLNTKTFRGKPKTSYGSRPTFDNTVTHKIPINTLTIEEFERLDFKQKQDYLSTLPIADMTKNQREFFNKYCLRDEKGNLEKF